MIILHVLQGYTSVLMLLLSQTCMKLLAYRQNLFRGHVRKIHYFIVPSYFGPKMVLFKFDHIALVLNNFCLFPKVKSIFSRWIFFITAEGLKKNVIEIKRTWGSNEVVIMSCKCWRIQFRECFPVHFLTWSPWQPVRQVVSVSPLL